MVSLHEEDGNQFEDTRKDKAQRVHTCRNPKKHMPLMNLLLRQNMVHGHELFCLVFSLTTVIKAGRILKERFYIRPPESIFLVNAVFDVRWTNIIL